MMLIDKKVFSNSIMTDIQAIKQTCNWDGIADDDTDSKRSAFDMLDKEKLRNHLIKEQHGICAYCMKRITNKGSVTNIDHRIPLSKTKEGVFDYHNLFAICKGGQEVDDRNRVLCCDASKSERKLTINPCEKSHIEKIKYSKQGKIYSNPVDPDLESDINEVLCLNGIIDENGNIVADTSTGLVKGRRDEYKKYESYIKGLAKKNKLKRSVIEQRINKLESEEIYDEYVGVMLYFLKHKLRAVG